MTSDPVVSTIIPVYNRPGMLAEAVGSVLAQTWRPIEIVIVDDGSTDETPEVATRIVAQNPDMIRLVRQTNGGPGRAREAGRVEARGDFLQYLDSDDLLLPRKFELQVEGLLEHPECGVSYGWTRLRHRDGSTEPAPWKGSGAPVPAMFPKFLQSRWWDTPTPLYRAELCRRAGSWTDLRSEEDWEYDCRVAALGVRLHYVPEWIAEVRMHDAGQLSGGPTTPAVLRDQARAHALILQHARSAGVSDTAPEMKAFAREIFFLARQCGASGLSAESERLFGLARDASGLERDRMQFRVYAALAYVVGWTATGKLGCLTDRWRA